MSQSAQMERRGMIGPIGSVADVKEQKTVWYGFGAIWKRAHAGPKKTKLAVTMEKKIPSTEGSVMVTGARSTVGEDVIPTA